MSNLPQNPYNANVGPPPVNAGQPMYNQPTPPIQGVSQAQYGALKQYPNSNSPVSTQPIGNHHGSYNSSANNSPAFNRPGQQTLPPPPSGMLPPGIGKPVPMSTLANISASSPFPPNYQPSRPITNIPPAAPYNQPSKPFVNGPVPSTPTSVPVSSVQQAGIGVNSSSMFTPPQARPPNSSIASQQVYPPQTVPAQPMSQTVTSHSNAPMIGSNLSATGYNSVLSGPTSHPMPPSNTQPLAFTPLSKPNTSYPGSMLPNTSTLSGQPPISMSSVSSPVQPQFSQPNVPTYPVGPSYPTTHTTVSQPPMAQQQPSVNGTAGNTTASFPLTPPGLNQGPQARPPMQQPFNGPQATGPVAPGPPTFPINRQQNMPSQMNAPTSYPPTSSYQQPLRPPASGPPYTGAPMAPNAMGHQQPPPLGPQQPPHLGSQQPPHLGSQQPPHLGPQQPPPLGQQNMPGQPGPPQIKMPPQPGPPSGPLGNTMQNRYPQMPQSNQNAQLPPQPGQYQQQQYNTQAVTQQMGQMSVTKQGFDQLWGHQSVDLLQCKHILPDYPEAPPEIKLGQQFAESANCSPDVFRCTVNRIPENNSLLQKSRLPLGILIHPFKDLDYLPVIQCSTIVRCRACRTYINPFVYFVDSKRWKCNLCFRVNDLPEEFQYDPVSKSYGDPARRPEIKSATIEFIAPGEYMLRPPQPAVYLFLLDVSQLARESGYLEVFCKTLSECLHQLPGDARTQVGFICYDAHVHYYLMSDGLTRPKEMTVLDIDDVFLPSPEALLVNLGERKELINELLAILPKRYSTPGVPASALGAALQAAYKLMAPTGGRITVLQTCLPNIGPGALQSREDPNARSAKDVAHLNPATDFYKRLALDCSGVQVAVDLFLLNSQYSDLATLSGISKFSGGSVYHIPLFKSSRVWQQDQFRRMLNRYLTRKIGFEAVMRVRCTRGVGIHTFHGNFFVRSTDLLSLPNVSPDTGFGMQLTIEESLSDIQQVCFQAALLYTSSKGERRIRVHTMALPIASNLTEVLYAADTHCIIGLLVKMAVDRCQSASMSEAREALINVAIDVMGAHKLAQNLSAASGLMAPASLSLLPLYLLAALKTKAFRTGTSTRLDDRVAQMCEMKSLPLTRLIRAVYPDLYPIHELFTHDTGHGPDPPRLQLTAERINSNCAYLLDDGETMIIYIGHAVSPAYLSETFGVTSFNQLPDEARSIPRIEEDENHMLHLFIDSLNDDRPYESNILVLRDNSPSRHLFTERLIEDRVESSFSYYEFLQHVKSQVK